MECQICGYTKHRLIAVTVITKQQKEKDARMCEECIAHICSIGIGEWFTLKTDETVKLPDRVFMRL